MLTLIKNAIGSASRYCFNNPLTLVQLARHAAGLRWAIPLDAVRWLVRQLPPGGFIPREIAVEARPPAIHIGARARFMGAWVRAGATVRVDELRFDPEVLRIELDVRDVTIDVVDPKSPLVQVLQSGAVDLDKPANLMIYVPDKPRFLVSAKDNSFILDLMKIPEIAQNPMLQKALRTLTPVVNVRAVRTQGDMLIVAFQANPLRVGESLAALRS